MRHLLLTLFLFLLSFNTISAQDNNSTRWYWALDENTGALLAYTASGNVNTLIDGGVEWQFGWRVDDQNALISAILQNDDQVHLYRLTSNQAQPIEFDFDTSSFVVVRDVEHPGNFTVWSTATIMAYTPQYILLRLITDFHDATIENIYDYVLINLSTYTGERLEIDGIANPCYFSLDETLLTCDLWVHLSEYPDDPATWLGRTEINLLTGQPTTYESPLSASEQLNTYGRLWRYNTEDWSFSRADYTGCDDNEPEVTEFCGPAILPRQNRLVVYNNYCISTCDIAIYTLGEDEPIEFTFARDTRTDISIRRILSDARLIVVLNTTQLWILDQQRPPEQIGRLRYWCSHTSTGNDPYNRWFIMAIDENNSSRYGIWDIRRESVVLEGSIQCPNVIYDEEGFIVHQHTAGGSHFTPILFMDSTQSTTELDDGWVYFEIISDNSLLAHPRDDQWMTQAIYRYDIELGGYVRLVANARPILFQPLDTAFIGR